MPYYTALIKVFIKDSDESHARETIKESMDFVIQQGDPLLSWGYQRTGDNQRAFPSLIKDQTFAENMEDTLDREREIKEKKPSERTDKEQEELSFLEVDNEESFDNL